MPLGPVFHAELMTTARRGRYYLLRVIYGLMVLFQVYVVHDSWSRARLWRSTPLTLNEMAEFAHTIFLSFATLQGVVVLLITPALVGGVIADERQRKTLHYLLTSQLSGGEIVVGKLAARLLQVGVFLLLGLPVLSLISLFGGVDPLIIVMTYAGTATSVFFLATMAILVSVRSRTPREAVTAVYLFMICWLFVPFLLLSILPFAAPNFWTHVGWWLGPALSGLTMPSPMYITRSMIGFASGSMLERTLWMMGAQVVGASVFVALAAWQLRPAFRTFEGGKRGFAWARKITAKRSWLPRPPVGDDAMLWKERYVSRSTGLAKGATLLVGFGMVCLLGYLAYDAAKPLLTELIALGWHGTTQRARDNWQEFVTGTTVVTYLLLMLGIASASAGAVTAEKEGDTWLSLTTTPLDGRDILVPKMLGAVWSVRFLIFVILLFWTLAVLFGTMHPLSLVLGVIELAIYCGFLSALGTSISLRSKNTTRALGLTVLILVVINGGYLFCCIPFRIESPIFFAGCTPGALGFSLMSYETVASLSGANQGGPFGRMTGEAIIAGALSLVGYLGAAGVLTLTAIDGFDKQVDRPDRFRRTVRITPGDKKRKSTAELE